MNSSVAMFILIPVIGYVVLWLLAGPLFLVYFRLYRVTVDLKHTVEMIRKLPPVLAIPTVPACSFIAFFLTTKIVSGALAVSASPAQALQVGIAALVCTIVLDMLITVWGEKIDIRIFPVNAMYLLAWLVIIPAIVLGR